MTTDTDTIISAIVKSAKITAVENDTVMIAVKAIIRRLDALAERIDAIATKETTA